MKRRVAIFLLMALLFNSICMAAPLPKKKETVYVNLDSYGKVNQVNIYSKWITNNALVLKDHTKYKTLTNLTSRETYVQSGDSVIWQISGEKYFTYTGEVGEEYYHMLPWTFDISYHLNGVEVTADELLGAQGLIKITMNIDSNKNANTYYRNNYMLEITGTYDMSEYLSVESEDAMITDTGNSKTLMFIVLPGQSTTIHVEMGSNDFSMDGITMAIVPITGDIRDQIVELIDDKDDIKDAIDSMNASADIVLNAMSGMTSGLNGVSAGVKEIKEGTKNLHALNDLREEDIESLKSLLNELLPLLENVQKDIDNLNDTYEIVIELDEKMNTQVKELSTNVNQLNNDLEEVNQLMKNLPNDVVEINELLKATGAVVGNTNTMIKKLSGSSMQDSSESLTKDLTTMAAEIKTIGALVQQTLPNVTDETVAGTLLKIGSSASAIGTNLQSVQGTLTEMSESTLKGTTALQSSLEKLKEELYDVSEILNKKDAKKMVGLITSLKESTETLEKILNTAITYNDKLLGNKEDFIAATTTMKQLTDEISKMDTISSNMLTNAQSMFNIVSTEIYNGTNSTADALISLNNQLSRITAQSNTIKKSKDDINKIVDDKMDEIEEKTTLLNLEKDAKIVSFGSEENEYVDSVQFVLKTPDIKKIKVDNEDLESQKESQSFWEKVGLIFQKILDWIRGLFQ